MRSQASLGDRLFDGLNLLLLGVVFVLVTYPLVHVVSASFSSPDAVASGRVGLMPVQPTLDGYRAVFRSRDVLTGYQNSLFYMGVGTAINIVLTICAAYPLSRRDFVGRGVFTFLLVFTMMFNGGLIPTFLVVRQLGLYNTRWALLLPNAVAVWHVVITRTYFQTTIPGEFLECARLDGCGNLRFVARIVVPLSAPIVAVIGLFYAVGHWNEFFMALIYLTDQRLYPLQLFLREILLQNVDDSLMTTDVEDLQRRQNLRELLKYSLIVVASIPVLVAYPFVQKYFVRGVMIGSLKG